VNLQVQWGATKKIGADEALWGAAALSIPKREVAMSLTQNHYVFAGLEESGVNTFLKALFTARPHYLRYGSSAFVLVSTVNATNMATIAFPGVPGGIQYAAGAFRLILEQGPSIDKDEVEVWGSI
jgi:hypothetical protein